MSRHFSRYMTNKTSKLFEYAIGLKLNKDGKAIEKATSFHLEFLFYLLWFNNKDQYLRS